MNKYELAYKNITENGGSLEDLKNDFELLHKLVKRATYKKPNFKYYPQTQYEPSESYLYCACCGGDLMEWGNYEYMSYCPDCGQAIEWEDIDER